MAVIIRGTTPTIKYKFGTVNVSDITKAILTLKVGDEIITEKDKDAATIGEDSISWKLTQQETLNVASGAEAMLNWVLADGTRGASNKTNIIFVANHKEEVI